MPKTKMLIEIPQDLFDSILTEIVNESSACALLDIQGVYEIVSSHFSDDVIAHWKSGHYTNTEHDNA